MRRGYRGRARGFTRCNGIMQLLFSGLDNLGLALFGGLFFGFSVSQTFVRGALGSSPSSGQ
jgi:hypothetical protein